MAAQIDTNLNLNIAGADLHVDNIYVTYDRLDRSVITKVFRYEREDLIRLAEELLSNAVKKVFVESTGSYYFPFALTLESRGIEVYIFNAFKTKNPDIDKRDDLDSAWLYALGKTGRVKASRPIDANMIALREAVRLRFKVADMIAASKKRIEAMLWRFGFIAKGVSKRLEGRRFREALKNALKGRVSKKFKNCSLIVWIAERARSGFQGFDLILNELSELEHLIKRREWLDERIRELAEPYRDQIKVLMSIPGIKFTLAVAILSEIGDINRFPSARHLVSYAGLRPTLRQSGKKRRHGKTSKKSNSRLRRFMYLAATAAMRSKDHRVRAFVARLRARGKHYKVIAVALARKLLYIAWFLLVRGECWRNVTPIG